MTKRLVIAALLVLAAPAQARAPTAAQIRNAVSRAEHSRRLWATVNICDTSRHPNVLGIRGQMPALGFPSRLAMRFQVQYWAASQHRFITDPGVAGRVSLGRAVRGLHQIGYQFQFKPPELLRAEVMFVWTRGGRVIGHTRRLTRGGHPHADFGDPRGYSTATCRIR